jgi:uncharacterized membrane protein
MKPLMILGIVIIILGVAGLIFGGINWTTQEKVVDVGALHVTAEKQHSIPILPIVGGVVLAGGIAVVVVGSRK